MSQSGMTSMALLIGCAMQAQGLHKTSATKVCGLVLAAGQALLARLRDELGDTS